MEFLCPKCERPTGLMRSACRNCGFSLTIGSVVGHYWDRLKSLAALRCPQCQNAVPVGQPACGTCGKAMTLGAAIQYAADPPKKWWHRFLRGATRGQKRLIQWIYLFLSVLLLLGTVAHKLTSEVQQAAAWAGDQTRKADEIRTLLRTLSQESKVRVTTATLVADSPTLDAAIQRPTAAELSAQQQVAAAKTDEARRTATETVANAEIVKIRETAEAEAARIVASAKAEAEAKLAAVDRELAMKKAEQVKADTETKVATETIMDEARKLELRKKAEDPAIQGKLKVFTTPGYWQVDKMTLDLKPHSFTKLRSRGALEPTIKGARELVRVVTDKDDKVRPRWKIQAFNFLNQPEQIEQIKEAQVLLNELGPTLVEMKMLEP